jgi:hypothetical protein
MIFWQKYVFLIHKVLRKKVKSKLVVASTYFIQILHLFGSVRIPSRDAIFVHCFQRNSQLPTQYLDDLFFTKQLIYRQHSTAKYCIQISILAHWHKAFNHALKELIESVFSYRTHVFTYSIRVSSHKSKTSRWCTRLRT